MIPSTAQSLRATRVSRRFGPATAVDDVSIEVPAGECLALVGESGSGKTTLLRMFNRTVEPDSGAVFVGEEDARTLDPVRLRRRVGYVPQEGGLLPHWRVLRNVALVPWLDRLGDPDGLARRALEMVGLDPRTFAERWPSELSGGQRQRAAIARALAARPGVLLLDEAFGALDAITRSDLHDLFLRLRVEIAVTTVLVTHDLSEAAVLGTRVAVMRAGRLEQVGAPREVFESPSTEYVERLVARSRRGTL